MRRSLLPALTLLLTLAPLSAAATQWHVDAAAAAGGNGSPQQPFSTLGQAVAALATGDTVLVSAGTYTETVHIAQLPQGSGGATTIKAASGAAPVIDGGGSTDFVVKVTETGKVSLEGLTLRNTTGSGVLFHKAHDGQVLSCTTQSVGVGVTFYYSDRGLVQGCDLQGGVSGRTTDGTVVRESTIHDSTGTGLYLHAGSKNCKYIANEIHDNLPDNIYIDSCSGMTVDRNLIYMTQAPPADHAAIQLADEQYPDVPAPVLDNITITNNVMVGNSYGVMFWEGSFPGQSGLKNVRVANNTIVNSAVAALHWDAGPHSAVIQNNILADDGTGTAAMLVMAKSTTGVTLDHNLWHIPWVNAFIHWDGTAMTHYAWVQATGQGAGDVTADPKLAAWTAPPAASFKLQPGSPAIDVGAALAFVTHDFDNVARPAGAGHDIGAFETGGSPPQPDSGPTADQGAGNEAGVPAADGAVTQDLGGAAGDGGADGSGDEGCACSAAGTQKSWPVALLVAMVLIGLRRRLRGERNSLPRE